MGASGWEYFVPYQPDIQAALDRLRHQAYEKGDYWKIGTRLEVIAQTRKDLERLGDESSIPKEQRIRGHLESYIRMLEALPEPKTIDEKIAEVMAINETDGANSILDIDRISGAPAFGVAAPLSDTELIGLFGTARPSHAMIVEHKLELMGWRDTSMATYVIVYRDDKPDEIYFTGFSGD
jgi:hypothetical protein